MKDIRIINACKQGLMFCKKCFPYVHLKYIDVDCSLLEELDQKPLTKHEAKCVADWFDNRLLGTPMIHKNIKTLPIKDTNGSICCLAVIRQAQADDNVNRAIRYITENALKGYIHVRVQ